MEGHQPFSEPPADFMLCGESEQCLALFFVPEECLIALDKKLIHILLLLVYTYVRVCVCTYFKSNIAFSLHVMQERTATDYAQADELCTHVSLVTPTLSLYLSLSYSTSLALLRIKREMPPFVHLQLPSVREEER